MTSQHGNPQLGNPHDGGLDPGDDGPLLPRGLVTPIPLAEHRIQQTVSRARRASLRRFRRPLLALMLLPLVLIASLLAPGGYRWDGRDPDSMTFGNAIQVIDEFETYHLENARSAQMKLWREMDHALDSLHQWGAMTPQLRSTVLDALDLPQTSTSWYGGGFEALRDKLALGAPLTEIEAAELGQAFSAGISAIRRLGEVHPRHEVYANLLRNRLRQKAER